MHTNRPSTWGPLLAALLAALAGVLVAPPADAGAAVSASARPSYVVVPAGPLASALANDGDAAPLPVTTFRMRSTPVTRAEFQLFLDTHPDWRRDRAPGVLAAAGYLRDWRSPAFAPTGSGNAPVVNVSWFAAQAFCEAEGGRLPTWNEWEYAAAADATRRDARDDPAWLARILGWYSRPANAPLPDVGGEPSLDGVRDLHGLVWEWVDDVGSLIVDADSRAGDDPDRLKFCGAGAINLQDRRNYAVLMRIALLSSLRAADSTGALGFRCVRPALDASKELR